MSTTNEISDLSLQLRASHGLTQGTNPTEGVSLYVVVEERLCYVGWHKGCEVLGVAEYGGFSAHTQLLTFLKELRFHAGQPEIHFTFSPAHFAPIPAQLATAEHLDDFALLNFGDKTKAYFSHFPPKGFFSSVAIKSDMKLLLEHEDWQAQYWHGLRAKETGADTATLLLHAEDCPFLAVLGKDAVEIRVQKEGRLYLMNRFHVASPSDVLQSIKKAIAHCFPDENPPQINLAGRISKDGDVYKMVSESYASVGFSRAPVALDLEALHHDGFHASRFFYLMEGIAQQCALSEVA